jgi:hypothetical protein
VADLLLIGLVCAVNSDGAISAVNRFLKLFLFDTRVGVKIPLTLKELANYGVPAGQLSRTWMERRLTTLCLVGASVGKIWSTGTVPSRERRLHDGACGALGCRLAVTAVWADFM